jgi:hypothetical protein
VRTHSGSNADFPSIGQRTMLPGRGRSAANSATSAPHLKVDPSQHRLGLVLPGGLAGRLGCRLGDLTDARPATAG